jgi:hypothetical protein
MTAATTSSAALPGDRQEPSSKSCVQPDASLSPASQRSLWDSSLVQAGLRLRLRALWQDLKSLDEKDLATLSRSCSVHRQDTALLRMACRRCRKSTSESLVASQRYIQQHRSLTHSCEAHDPKVRTRMRTSFTRKTFVLLSTAVSEDGEPPSRSEGQTAKEKQHALGPRECRHSSSSPRCYPMPLSAVQLNAMSQSSLTYIYITITF